MKPIPRKVIMGLPKNAIPRLHVAGFYHDTLGEEDGKYMHWNLTFTALLIHGEVSNELRKA